MPGPTPKIECAVRSKDRLGETPLWCGRERKLWWIDIDAPCLQSFDPATGRHDVHPMPGDAIGSLALTRSDRLLAGIDLALSLVDPADGTAEPLVEVERDLDNRLNDGRVDPSGRFWVGTLDNGLTRPNAGVYRVDPDGRVTRMFGDVIVTNGIAHAPDGRIMYFTDTRRFLTWAFEIDPVEGAILSRRLFADYRSSGDRPDGACIDVDGCLWQAFFSGARIVRYAPDGRVDRVIALPTTNPTCLCFGGRDLSTLYVTTATKFLTPGQIAGEPLSGSLLAIEGAGQGLPENRFARA